MPGDGKTTVALNFADLLAASGKRVLLIDCDLRNPELSRLLSAPNQEQAGLLELLTGTLTLSELITVQPSGVNFIRANTERAPAHSSDVMASSQMQTLLNRAKDLYDYIVLDLPPMAPIVDVGCIAPIVDAFVLVAQWGVTLPSTTLQALNTMPGVHDRLLGVVLNKIDMAALRRYGEVPGNEYYVSDAFGRYLRN
jgi:succinoglycan biosynthesis transport protein ExoP